MWDGAKKSRSRSPEYLSALRVTTARVHLIPTGLTIGSTRADSILILQTIQLMVGLGRSKYYRVEMKTGGDNIVLSRVIIYTLREIRLS